MGEIESARRQALLDWATTGEFNDSQYIGAAKSAYNDAAAKIQQQWDTQAI